MEKADRFISRNLPIVDVAERTRYRVEGARLHVCACLGVSLKYHAANNFGCRSIRRPIKPLGARRKYLAAVFGNADAMFELRAEAPVARYCRPAIFQHLACCLADVDHRLDGEDHAGAKLWPGPRTSGVDDFGGVVE